MKYDRNGMKLNMVRGALICGSNTGFNKIIII